MPQDEYIERLPTVDLDSEPLKLDIDELGNAYALQMVTRTFSDYEAYRSMNHDPRWTISDTLYWGYLPQKVWEGTSVPRSSLGMPIVFDQIEAALPAISQELFSPQDDWFQVAAEPGTDPKEAEQVQEHLSYILEHTKSDYGFSARNEIEMATKFLELYGNGGIWVEYDSILDRPVVECVDIRDFYIDPGCCTPNIDDARSIIRRKFMTVETLSKLRDDARMTIPSDDALYTMSKSPYFAIGDQTKSNQEAFRGVSYTPNVSDYTVMPSDRKIEVLMYYSKARIVWVLNREKVIYNQDNPYGFMPACFAPCYIVPGRFYAQSIADVQEGNQRCIEGLLNGRLDSITMELIPPRIYKRGVLMTPSQLRWHPGATSGADDVKDMALMQPTTSLANVFTEIGYLTDVAEQRTGINSMTSGIPKPSNTNRTATGVSAVASGSMSRLRELVSNIENYMIVPMLYKLYKLVQMHNTPGKNLPGITKNGEVSQVSSDAFQNKMRFRMLSASRMMTREKLAQVFPFLTQYMINGTFMGELHKAGKTIDFSELFRMLQDATGTGKLYNFVRAVTPEEQQAMQQPNPELVAKAQQSQAELQTRLQISQQKNQTDLQKAQIAKAPDPMENQQEQQRMMMEAERDQMRMKHEKDLAQFKIQAEHDKHQVAMQGKAQELRMKGLESAMNVHAVQQQNQLQLDQMKQQGEMQQNQDFTTHVLGMKQGAEVHQQKLENMKAEGGEKEKMRKKAQIRKKGSSTT